MSNIYDPEEDYDFADVDCEDCGMKFYVRPSRYSEQEQQRRERDGKARLEWPRKCTRCLKGLPPPYEY